MRASGLDAVEWCRQESAHPSRYWAFQCLGNVTASWDLVGGAADAWSAWSAAKQHSMAEPAPPGAPFYWSLYSRSPNTGLYKNFGHVAVSDTQLGWCWSIDFLRHGFVDRVRISDITNKWGARPVGWSSDLPWHGDLPLTITPPPPPSPPPPSGVDMITVIYISSDAPTGSDDDTINAQRWAWADFIGEFDPQAGITREVEWLTEAYKDQLVQAGVYSRIPKECRNEQTAYYSMRLIGAMPEETSIGGPKNWSVTDFRAVGNA